MKAPVRVVAVTRGDIYRGKLSVMVVRTLAFMIVRRVLGLAGLGSAPKAKDIESPFCGIS
jgi:hypothetical protein